MFFIDTIENFIQKRKRQRQILRRNKDIQKLGESLIEAFVAAESKIGDKLLGIKVFKSSSSIYSISFKVDEHLSVYVSSYIDYNDIFTFPYQKREVEFYLNGSKIEPGEDSSRYTELTRITLEAIQKKIAENYKIASTDEITNYINERKNADEQ